MKPRNLDKRIERVAGMGRSIARALSKSTNREYDQKIWDSPQAQKLDRELRKLQVPIYVNSIKYSKRVWFALHRSLPKNRARVMA